MSTAREHIDEAENLLVKARRRDPLGLEPFEIAAYELLTAQAQVHADLANARLQLDRLDRAAGSDRILAALETEAKRTVDPRANRKGYKTRTANKTKSRADDAARDS